MATSSATTRRIRPANQKIYTQQPALGMTPGPAIFLVFCMRGWAAHCCTQRPAQRRAPGPTMSNHPPGIEPGRSGRAARAAWPPGKRTLAPPFLRRKDSGAVSSPVSSQNIKKFSMGRFQQLAHSNCHFMPANHRAHRCGSGLIEQKGPTSSQEPSKSALKELFVVSNRELKLLQIPDQHDILGQNREKKE